MRILCLIAAVAFTLVPFRGDPQTALRSFKPVSGEESERLMNQLLPPAELRRDTFVFTIRILPPFSPLSQITVEYDWQSKASITASKLRERWGQTINLYKEQNDRLPDPPELKRMFTVDVRKTEAGRETAEKLLNGFWAVLGERSRSGTAQTLKDDGTDSITFYHPDATLYEVQFQDYRDYIRFSTPGGDPSHARPPSDRLDPLVRWILSVDDEFGVKPSGGK
jgi:hypothetical protein